MSITSIEMAIRDMASDKKTIEAIIRDKKTFLDKLSDKDIDRFERGLLKGSIMSLNTCLKLVIENIINVTKQYDIEQRDEN